MKLEDQELLFGIFHDGGVENIKDAADGIEFTVDIMYLAERIKPQFTGVMVKLIHPAELYFEDVDTNTIIRKFEQLNELEYEILSAEISGEQIMVSCSMNHGESFGYLMVKAKEIDIYDPEGSLISLEKLKTISQSYWDDLRNRGR